MRPCFVALLHTSKLYLEISLSVQHSERLVDYQLSREVAVNATGKFLGA